MEMKLEVLLSCMHQTDHSIIESSNLQGVQTLVVNQCSAEAEQMEQADPLHRFLHTPTRGLSVSRNLAIQNALGEICLLADDDEVFSEELEEIILGAYERLPEADIILFKIENLYRRLGDRERRLKKHDLFHGASCQISFRRESIRNRVSFDPRMGTGSGNGGGEENKLLLDCYRKGLKIYYCPVVIGRLLEQESAWFFGFNETYFYQRGMTTRHIMGLPMSLLYGAYFLLTKRSIYREQISMSAAAKQLLRGIFNNDLRTKN